MEMVMEMMKEEKLKNEIEKLEQYMLGDVEMKKLDVQIISFINSHERLPIEQSIRSLLKWILTDKYHEIKED